MNLPQQRLSKILLMTIQLLSSVNQIAEIKQRTYRPLGSYKKRLIGSLPRSIITTGFVFIVRTQRVSPWIHPTG